MKLRTLSLLAACCAVASLRLRDKVETAGGDAPHSRPASGLSRTPQEFRRPAANTFLTVPEWSLVWSPQEYAELIAAGNPGEFPYLGHIAQFWTGYAKVYRATKDDYPPNPGYHLMNLVIGGSTTVEYAAKSLYENVVGRAAEACRGSRLTEEDRLAADVARRYVDFIVVEPWYRFDFLSPLTRLWTDTGFWGASVVRKWERKYFLTTEYAVKAGYGWLIEKASGAVYDEERPVTAVIIDRAPADSFEASLEVKAPEQRTDGTALLLLPRYQAFTGSLRALAMSGANVVEVAGNSGAIVVSAVVPADYDASALEVLVDQTVLTRPSDRRIFFVVSVPELCSTIRLRDKPPFRLEHIYDY